jgi:membrane-associated protease RseP (regulator of RpoE activity)
LNLIPIGQLDGGHILYCLLGKRAHVIARGVFLTAVAVVIFNLWRGHPEYASWTLMLVLIWLMGTRHPPTANDRMPLGAVRVILGWLTLAFILVGFVPAPTYRNEPVAPQARAGEQAAQNRIGP